jgi:hypothetical protein
MRSFSIIGNIIDRFIDDYWVLDSSWWQKFVGAIRDCQVWVSRGLASLTMPLFYYNSFYNNLIYNKGGLQFPIPITSPLRLSFLSAFVVILQQTRTLDPKTVDKQLNRVYYNTSYYISVYTNRASPGLLRQAHDKNIYRPHRRTANA